MGICKNPYMFHEVVHCVFKTNHDGFNNGFCLNPINGSCCKIPLLGNLDYPYWENSIFPVWELDFGFLWEMSIVTPHNAQIACTHTEGRYPLHARYEGTGVTCDW
jgi:hypothetical protein